MLSPSAASPGGVEEVSVLVQRSTAPAHHKCLAHRSRVTGSGAERDAALARRGRRPVSKVVDPFCGRGTVLAVARAAGLPALGVDVDAGCARAATRLDIGRLMEPRPSLPTLAGMLRICGGSPPRGLHSGSMAKLAARGGIRPNKARIWTRSGATGAILRGRAKFRSRVDRSNRLPTANFSSGAEYGACGTESRPLRSLQRPNQA